VDVGLIVDVLGRALCGLWREVYFEECAGLKLGFFAT